MPHVCLSTFCVFLFSLPLAGYMKSGKIREKHVFFTLLSQGISGNLICKFGWQPCYSSFTWKVFMSNIFIVAWVKWITNCISKIFSWLFIIQKCFNELTIFIYSTVPGNRNEKSKGEIQSFQKISNTLAIYRRLSFEALLPEKLLISFTVLAIKFIWTSGELLPKSCIISACEIY